MLPMEKESSRSILIDIPNKRIKVLEYQREEIEEIDRELEQMAKQLDATKLIIYAKKADVPEYIRLNYRFEGMIDGFFQGTNAHMLARYLSEERALSKAPELADEIVKISLSKLPEPSMPPLPSKYKLRQARLDDADKLAALYGLVFKTYPTPMDQPEYVRKTMHQGTCYYVIETDGQIVSAASAEVTHEYGSAEITDCATHPDYLGNGLLKYLFPALEEKMRETGVYYLYTLTRAQSHGMNITAAKQGYQYRGRLVNNCTIFSGFEDMNIWVKPLKETRDE